MNTLNQQHEASATPVLRGLWWLDPTLMFALVGLGTLLIAFVSPEEFYAFHRTPKYVDWQHVALGILAVGGFTIGSLYGRSFDPEPADARIADSRWLWKWFLIAAGLSFLGYAVWTFLATKNGLTVGLVERLLFGGDETTFEQLKEKVFVRIPGVTTATQFGMATMLLGLILWNRGERLAGWVLGGLIAVSAARALLFSERLALIELALPSVVLWVRFNVLGNRLPTWKASAWKMAPVAGISALVVMFGGFEYFRSWQAHQNNHSNVVEFTLMRLSGYYNMAVNSCAMQIEKEQSFSVPWTTTQFFWQFPLVRSSPLSYTTLTGRNPDDELMRLLEQYANPELNNDGGLLLPYFDFGMIGLPIFWGILGLGVGYVYRNYQAGRLMGLAIYPLCFIGILEVPRIVYFTSQRAFPSLFLLIAFAYFLRYQVPRWNGNRIASSTTSTPVAPRA